MQTINILGIPYKIEYVECVNKFEPRKGEIDFVQCVIRIDRTMPPELQQQTLLHEILHGILDALGYTGQSYF